MNLFETVKSAVTVKQAAEHYGYEVNRGDMICCPFHDDRHPSMKLNRDYFYCFGCGAAGDVIDFVDELDDRFVEACHMIEYVDHLLDVLMFAELKQRVKAVDMLLKDGTITALEQRLRRLEKEVQHRGEERAIA